MSSDKVQILVVDDDVSHCTILQALLRGWGYQVALAHNGLQALEQIHQQVFDRVMRYPHGGDGRYRDTKRDQSL